MSLQVSWLTALAFKGILWLHFSQLGLVHLAALVRTVHRFLMRQTKHGEVRPTAKPHVVTQATGKEPS